MRRRVGWVMAVFVIGAAWVRSWERPVAAPKARPAEIVKVVESVETREARPEAVMPPQDPAPAPHRRGGWRLR